MHRERRELIVKFSVISLIIILWIYITFPWYIVIFYLAVILSSFIMLPPDEMYIERDEMLAKERAKKSE